MAILRNLLGSRTLEESHRTTAGTPSILPKSFCSNNLRNLIHSNRRFKVDCPGTHLIFLAVTGGLFPLGYHPDSGIDDNHWWKILAVGKA
jgi:hypothetical protein